MASIKQAYGKKINQIANATRISNKASTVSRLTTTYINSVQHFDIRNSIMDKINGAIPQGSFIVEVEIPRHMEKKFIEEFKGKNYLILKDNREQLAKLDRLNKERFDRTIKEQEQKQKHKDPNYIPPVQPPTRDTTLNKEVKYFIVWAGSNRFCNKFIEDKQINDRKRGAAIMNYVKQQVGLNPGEQIWVNPDTKGLSYGNDSQKITIYKKLSDIAKKYS